MPRSKNPDRPARISTTVKQSIKDCVDTLLRDESGKLPYQAYQRIIEPAFEKFVKQKSRELIKKLRKS